MSFYPSPLFCIEETDLPQLEEPVHGRAGLKARSSAPSRRLPCHVTVVQNAEVLSPARNISPK